MLAYSWILAAALGIGPLLALAFDAALHRLRDDLLSPLPKRRSYRLPHKQRATKATICTLDLNCLGTHDGSRSRYQA
jgi:hypothetical protein